ncbi:MAG TPA: dTDP-4-dehydrorhamnose 3,5-epimerase [Bdellovibrionales bacterium]|nr:dTDP-4-dehydrorhamnose 3,5-epimerase [Bdellovibrionales bacterium]
MKLQPTPIDGLVLLENRIFEDSRGHFVEVYKNSVFRELGLPREFVQDNLSVSRKGVVRGLHYQIDPFAQGKLVRCLDGSLFDVAVDLRRGSKTFGKWYGVVLKPTSQALYIPPGFAHGFQALEDQSLIYYKCTSEYAPAHERGLRFDDPELAIKWPLKPEGVSEKDLKLPTLRELGAGL